MENLENTAALPAQPRGKGIVIIDDFFPNLTTGFRVAEYNHYLRVFPHLVIASTTGDFKQRHKAYATSYPDLKNRVVPFDRALLSHAKLCYLNFLNNAHYHLEHLEAVALPFLFTLYPGGGFELQSEQTNAKLDRVLRSPMLRGVISTQSVTTDILRRMQCPVEIYQLFGATINPTYLRPPARNRVSRDGGLNICFVAYKYDPQGRSKGYPTFIEVATRLSERFPDIAFSVVGNYGPDDVSIPDRLGGKLRFKGPLATSQLRRFLLTQDLMISPNQPFTVSGSIFDGFPTAACVEASLCGVAIVCSDELNLNRFYDSDEMIVCAPAASAILEAIEPLLVNHSLIAQLGERGRQKSMSLYSAEAQLLPRTQILRDAAAREGFLA
jgi:lipopolysaccharide transport system ATP-binding protein